MNTIQIRQALKTNLYTKRYFQSVFPANNLSWNMSPNPDLIITKKTTLINQEIIGLPFTLFRNQNILIGMVENHWKKNFLEETATLIHTYNKQQLQAHFSSTCRHYALLGYVSICTLSCR